jgi:lipoate-protein ligase B
MLPEIIDLGLVEFEEAYKKQVEIFAKIKAGQMRSAFIICSHRPVITLGRSFKPGGLLASSGELSKRGVRVIEVSRGGDITYHGPGQLVVYPILDLNFLKKDIHWYLRSLEDLIIDYLRYFDIGAGRVSGLTGVWVSGKKIASIGVSVKNWITLHGLSINILKDDLSNFSLIKPCGMDIIITSLESELSRSVSWEYAASIFKENLKGSIYG